MRSFVTLIGVGAVASGAIAQQPITAADLLKIRTVGSIDLADDASRAVYSVRSIEAGEEPGEELRRELVSWVRQEIGPIASPDVIQWAPGLPKTRSGKIMRRILRKIAENDYSALGDTSTLADPAVVEELIANHERLA